MPDKTLNVNTSKSTWWIRPLLGLCFILFPITYFVYLSKGNINDTPSFTISQTHHNISSVKQIGISLLRFKAFDKQLPPITNNYNSNLIDYGGIIPYNKNPNNSITIAQTDSDSTDYIPNIDFQTSDLHELCFLWQSIFYNTFVIRKLYQNTQLTTIESKYITNRRNQSFDLTRLNINSIENFYQITQTGLETSITNEYAKRKHNLSVREKNRIIKLRRQIMIVHAYLQFHFTENNNKNNKNKNDNTNTNTNNINDDNVYKKLILLFGEIYNDYLIMKPKLSFYNIHVSKAMGSSICHTFKNLHLRTINSAHNCNYFPKGGTPNKAKGWYASCQELENMVRKNKYDLIASEGPLGSQSQSKDTDSDSDPDAQKIAAICDNFDYMLPFRNPIERMFSHYNQWTKHTGSPLYVKDRKYNTNTKFNQKKGTSAFNKIEINGIKYHGWHQNEDLKGFISNIFVNEPLYARNETYSFDDELNIKRSSAKSTKSLKSKHRGAHLQLHNTRNGIQKHGYDGGDGIRQSRLLIEQNFNDKKKGLVIGGSIAKLIGNNDPKINQHAYDTQGKSILTKNKMLFQKVSNQVEHDVVPAVPAVPASGSSNLNAHVSSIGNTNKNSNNRNRAKSAGDITWFGGEVLSDFLVANTEHRADNGLIPIRQLRGISSNYYTRFLGYNYSVSIETNMINKNEAMPSITAASYCIDNKMFENSIELMFKIAFVFPLSTHEFSETHSMMHFLFDLIKYRAKNGRNSHSKNNNNRRRFAEVSGWAKSNVQASEWYNTHGMVNEMSDEERKIINYKNQWDMQLFELSAWIADVDADFYQNYNVDLDVFH